MGNLTHYSGSNLAGGNNPGSPGDNPEPASAADGYESEDFVPGSCSASCRERKKGVPWTQEEHRMFLLGLQKLGKGDWRGISRNFVVSRTPTQVASHAQKYFIRQTNVTRRKRRSSLFDIVADEAVDTPVVAQDLFPVSHQQPETQTSVALPPPLEEECESMDSTNSSNVEAVVPKTEIPQCNYPVVFPGYFSPFFPFSFPFWPGYSPEAVEKNTHEVFKPTAVHSKDPINVDELVGMSKLSLGERLGHMAPSSLSLKLIEGSARQSAFHANPSTGGSSMNSGTSAIHAL